MKTSNRRKAIDGLVPKIWFDHFFEENKQNESENDCDCDCACPSRHNIVENSISVDSTILEDSIYQATSSLYHTELHDGYYIACDALEIGRVTVLDSTTNSILKYFQSPGSFAQVQQTFSYLPEEVVAKMVIQLQNLGLLENKIHPFQPAQRTESKILTAWLHITNDCNLSCTYCYIHKTPDEMASDIALQTIDAIFRSATINHFERVKLKFAGGEASLNFLHVLAIYDYAKNLSVQSNISLEAIILSNGVAISDSMINELTKRQIRVMISLDGINDYHDAQRIFANGKGSFKHVDRTITRLLNHGLIADISVTVSNRNLGGLSKLMEYLLDRDLPFSLNYYRENECSEFVGGLRYGDDRMIEAMRAAFRVVEKKLPRRTLLGCLIDRASLSMPHKHTCGVGRNYLIIDQNGGVAKCQMDILNTVTTIHTEDVLREIQNDGKGIRNMSVEEKEGCRYCEWRYWCAGGCPMLTYRAIGRYDFISPNCDIYKSLFPEVLRLEALRLLKYFQPWKPDYTL